MVYTRVPAAVAIGSDEMRSVDKSRRRFLTTTGAVSLAMATAPAFVGATDKSGIRPVVVGVEGHRYEVHHDFLDVPASIPWQETHGVAVDKAGHIYIKHRTKTRDPIDAIVVFDAKGKYVRSFGKTYHGGGHGVDIREEDGEEFLYVCDNKGYIAKLAINGEVVWTQTAPKIQPYNDAAPYVITEPGKIGKGKHFSPTNIAFAPDGGFFVGDGYGSHYVIRYDRNGKVLGYFGGRGSEAGKLSTPHGLWWDARPGRTPALVVADRANKRLQYFDVNGNHLSFVEDFLFPADIDIRGDVMLVSDLHARITILDKDNNVVTHLGDDKAWRATVLADNFAMRSQSNRWENGRFIHPHDACFDQDGNILVVEWVTVGRASFLRHVG
jgi:DNA-binding beta-propeller fold protein YncE